MNDHTYMGVIDRDKYRVKATAEVFTPTDLVIRMLEKSNIHDYAPGKTVLDPACGDGQFLTAIKWIKVFAFNMSEEEALELMIKQQENEDMGTLAGILIGVGFLLILVSFGARRKRKGGAKKQEKKPAE